MKSLQNVDNVLYETHASFGFTTIFKITCLGLPAIITAISVGVRFKDYGTDK